MTKFGALFALAASGVLSAAAFVRPPVTPVTTHVATGPTKKVKTANHGGGVQTGATPGPLPAVNAVPFAVAPGISARTFVVEEIAFAPWGDALGSLGRKVPNEANPEGPMSFAVDAKGSVHVLDQLNQRLAILDPNVGGPSAWRVLGLPSETIQDVAIDPAGGWALLDRLVDRAVIFLDATGVERKRVSLVGTNIDEPGVITGLFAAADGFWVELEHTNVVRVATPSGDPDPLRPLLEGRRPNAHGPLLRAARDPAGFAVVSALATSGGFMARVPFTTPVLALVGLEADGAGNTFVAAHLGDETQSFALVNERLEVVALDPKGTEIGRFALPPPDGPEEVFRSIAIAPNGQIHHLHVGNAGATIRRAL